MGAVWLARDTTLGRDVAIKRIGMMPGGTTPDQDRAAREARLAARLNHAHVVQVFDLITEEGVQWLVMEYVDGQTLSGLIRDQGALPPERASALLGQVADALAAAHAAGVVHRDVKPSNILVAADDQVKLSDFGIAKADAEATLTETGLVTGSPAYLSPEVASGQTATTASDVWSLGATLFHALSGRPPYQVGDNLLGALFRIVHDDPPRLPGAEWPAPLLEVTMTKDPAERWSMQQVRDYLDAGPSHAVAPGEAEPEATQVMVAPVVPAPTPTPPSAPTAPVATTTSPEPASEEPEQQPGRRVPVLAIAVTAVALLVAGLLAWVLLGGDDEGETPTIDRPESSESAGRSGDARPSGSGSVEPPSSSPADPRPTAAGMESFVVDYLATAPTSPETTFQMLTPGFQRASGGLETYAGYWQTIASADPVEVSADPESLVVEYVVAYVREDGSEVTDEVQLQLEFRDGDYLIASEA